MIAIPAVDLRDGACVQLVGGDYAREQVRVADPVAAARRWFAAGFRLLHVVDLDAALSRGSNAGVIERIVRGAPGAVQVGGGIRSTEVIERLLGWGAFRVVIGTRALADPEWLAAQAAQFPGRLLVAADIRGGKVATHGWTDTLDEAVEETLARLADLPLAGLLVTAVDVEGQMLGPALDVIARVMSACAFPIIASGGVASGADLKALASRGVAGTVIGMALYTGALDARAVAREFAS